MSTLGHTLATERLRQNLDLDQVAKVTRITPRLLKAIELDDFEQLPGRVFARNFVRQYGQFLRLDANDLVAQFDREQSPAEPEEPPRSTALRIPRRFSLNLPALSDVFGNTILTSFIAFVATLGLCAAGVWTFDHWGLHAHAVPSRPAPVMPKITLKRHP